MQNDTPSPPKETALRAYAPWVTLATFCGLAVLNFVDRSLLAAALPAIKAEFALTDTALGALSAAFAIIYAVGGVPVAHLADRSSRKRIVLALATVWSLATAACGSVNHFLGLLLCRMGVAFGEAGYMPAVYSSLSDLFSRARRNLVSAFIITSCSLGTALGLALGGQLTASYGWRAAFTYVGLAGLIVILIASPLIREPSRGTQDGDRAPAASNSAPLKLADSLKRLFSEPVFTWSILATGFFGFSQGMVYWIPSFFERVHHIPLSRVGLLTGGTFGVGIALGTLLSGFLAERMARRDVYAPLKLCMLANVLLLPTFITALVTGTLWLAMAATLVMSLVGALGGPPLTAVVQNCAPPAQRATAHAMLTLSLSVIGYGLVPLCVGRLSDALQSALGPAKGLQYAMLASSSVFVIAFFCAWRAHRAARRLTAVA